MQITVKILNGQEVRLEVCGKSELKTSLLMDPTISKHMPAICSDRIGFSVRTALTLINTALVLYSFLAHKIIQVSENDQISLVKKLASEKLDVPVEQQRLVFKGKTLAGTVYIIVCFSTN